MKHAIARWLLYFTVGLPVQFIMYLLYPIAIILFRKKWKNKHGVSFGLPASPFRTIATIIDKGAITHMRDEVYDDNQDEHTALLHYGVWSYKAPYIAQEGLRRMVRADGGIERKYPVNPLSNPVSRDCLTTWTYSYTMFGGPKEELKKVLKHYLKYCFGLTHFNGLVSARNSSSGLNYVFDGYKKLSQPVFGPNYYGSAALLSLARKELGGIWHLVYAAHFMLMGGWLWWLEPIIYNDKFLLYYDHHITAMNLSTLMHNSPSILTKKAMRRVVVDIAPANNMDVFFYAMAWNSGVLTEAERAKATLGIRSASVWWPQTAPLGDWYFKDAKGPGNWSMMGYHAKLLINEPFKKFNK